MLKKYFDFLGKNNADPTLDLAVLKIQGDFPIQPVVLGDSDVLNIGDWAICIGNPGNGAGNIMTGTVTAGIISALDREVDSGSTSTDPYGRKVRTKNKMIQTDAAINNGNSGGGMFNTAGQLVGIPNMKYSGTRSSMSSMGIENIGLCIPINEAKDVIAQALNAEPVQQEAQNTENGGEEASSSAMLGKPRLGVTIADVNTSSRAAQLGQIPDGVFITEVEKDSPAEQAGLLAGDIIVDVDDTVITDANQLKSLIGQHKAGDTLKVKVYRAEGLLGMTANQDAPEGEYIDLEVTLAIVDIPEEEPQDEGFLYAQ